MKGGMSYTEALKSYENIHHVPANKNWRSVLYLATSLEDGDRISSLLDLEAGEAKFDEFVESRNYQILSSGERIMIDLAWLLFSHRDSFSLLDALNTLDEENWNVFIKAIEIYRQG